MRWSQLGMFSTIIAAAPVSAAHAQRLTPWFASSRPTLSLTEAGGTASGAEPLRLTSACRHGPVLSAGLGMIAGAVGGLVVYEVPFGMVIAGEGASSRPFARDIRYSLMAAGAVVGGVWGFVTSRNCHISSAGA